MGAAAPISCSGRDDFLVLYTTCQCKIALCSRAEPQRLDELSRQVREYVAVEDAQVLPLSAHTGIGLDSIRTALASALGRHPSFAVEATPAGRNASPLPSGPRELEERCPSGTSGADKTPGVKVGLKAVGSETLDATEPECGVDMAEAPEGAATATVLDYTSSAKTGKLLVSAVPNVVFYAVF